MSLRKNIWVYRYAPKNFNEIILNDEIRSKLGQAIEEIPNLLLYGTPGIGKGCFANILKEKDNIDYMWINASDENGIDVFRNKIRPFATAMCMKDMKVVILNECLDENEEILLTYNKKIKLKDLPKNKEFELLSFNLKTRKVENDIGSIISEKKDDVYEVELEDGKKLKLTKNHPLIIEDENGNLIEKKLEKLKEGDKIITL